MVNLAMNGKFRWSEKNCRYDLNKESFQGLDKFPVIADIRRQYFLSMHKAMVSQA
jgi:hypothetical protein